MLLVGPQPGHPLLSLFIPLTSMLAALSICSHVTFGISARTRLSADGKSAAKGGQRQFTGITDVYRQTLRTDGVLGLYRGFVPNILGIIVYRGL